MASQVLLVGLSFSWSSVDGDVIHVDGHVSFIDEIPEDGVYHRLEGGWRISESEEHYCRFEESLVCYERRFPPVLWLDKDFVVSPFDIEPGEQSSSS